MTEHTRIGLLGALVLLAAVVWSIIFFSRPAGSGGVEGVVIASSPVAPYVLSIQTKKGQTLTAIFTPDTKIVKSVSILNEDGTHRTESTGIEVNIADVPNRTAVKIFFASKEEGMLYGVHLIEAVLPASKATNTPPLFAGVASLDLKKGIIRTTPTVIDGRALLEQKEFSLTGARVFKVKDFARAHILHARSEASFEDLANVKNVAFVLAEPFMEKKEVLRISELFIPYE